MSCEPSPRAYWHRPRHSMPVKLTDFQAPPTTKFRRRVTGLGYIRDNEADCVRRPSTHSRNTGKHITSAHPRHTHPTVHGWGSPDSSGDLFWTHRSPSAGPVPGSTTPLFTSKDSLRSPSTNMWRVPASQRDTHAYFPPRHDRRENLSYAPSHATPVLSSPQSTSSPMFSDSVGTASSNDALHCHYHYHHRFQPMHDSFTTLPLFHTFPQPPSPTIQMHSIPRDARVHSLGLTAASSHVEMPRARRRHSISHSSSHSHEEHVASALQGGLDRWFPGLMYAFEPTHDNPDTSPTHGAQEMSQAGPDDSVDEFPLPNVEPNSPPLRSLQLVAKYFGEDDETDEALATLHAVHNTVRCSSPGELHGLGMSLPPDALHDMPTPVPTPPRRAGLHLRPLHLAERHGLEPSSSPLLHTNVHSNSGTPKLDHDDAWSTTSSSRGNARHRVPFAVLHPPMGKTKPDSDAVRLYWFGFLGMPWLWLLGSWCLDDHGVLLSPWSPPSFLSYRAGLHPYGPPFALPMHAHNQFLQQRLPPMSHTTHAITQEPHVFGSDHRGVQFLSQYPPESVPLGKLHQWQHTESFVLLNRMAAVLSSFTLFACWTNGVWPIMSHF